MNIRPLADRVLIEPTAAEEVTVSGIIIPDSAKEKPLKGKVLAVGNGLKDEPMILKEGDLVLYGTASARASTPFFNSSRALILNFISFAILGIR